MDSSQERYQFVQQHVIYCSITRARHGHADQVLLFYKDGSVARENVSDPVLLALQLAVENQTDFNVNYWAIAKLAGQLQAADQRYSFFVDAGLQELIFTF